ncbi:PBECR2 nuclease fold domain-containing protein [Gallaecimonas kandeliae]|uniref:PBECR2 nuclease fold domain-containing protein n=1 Tax=Gallaecimonas kandeliae TaxID=3029055 RepID=UPI002649D8DB|nr:PBECR2 nuclease fold domain-containing protein [Gallaecimonas kandeliae]WKE65064.1 PBECR2 nuclease fold domain-containing protein [Gallaecimonas kandeliae]
MASSVSYGSVPFPEQIRFFRKKLNVPTQAWTDIYGAEHDWAFMVAGATRDALLADFRQAVEKAIAEGTTLEDFRKDFDAIVARHGWDYKGGRNWRSRVIYETNLYSSYGAGRYAQLWADRDILPFWQYHHSDAVSHPRPLHLSWNGIILKATDPWWRTHSCPNGWGCQCFITGLSAFDMEQQGLSPSPSPTITWQTVEVGKRSPGGPRTVRVPDGIDPGFEHTPGRARLESAVPPPIASPNPTGTPSLPSRPPGDLLPEPRPVSASLSPATSPEQAVSDFLSPFGATSASPAVFQDVVGERLAIGKTLLTDASGALASTVPTAELPLVAKALQAPDEIWVRLEWHPELKKATLTRLYLARFQVPGQPLPVLVVVQWGADGWRADVGGQNSDLWRTGVRLYRRGDN